MRTKVLLAIVATALLVLVAASLLRPRSRTSPSTPEAQANGASEFLPGHTNAGAITSKQATPMRQPHTPAASADAGLVAESLPPGSNLNERLEELARRKGVPLNVLTQQAMTQWSNAMGEAAQEMNRPISFYGKAVNEKGEPISGANIRFSCVVFPEKRFTTNAISDGFGMFSLTGITGATLNVRVSKEGYEEVRGTNQNSFAYYSPTGTGFSPNANFPVIFNLRKKE